MTTCNKIICTCLTVRSSRGLEVLEFSKVGPTSRENRSMVFPKLHVDLSADVTIEASLFTSD